MLSLFLEYPVITGIAIILALILVSFIGNTDPRLGEIMGMQMIFPVLVIGVMAILWIILAIIKSFQPRKTKNIKSRSRARK